MATGPYLIGVNGQLVRLAASEFPVERSLQELIAEHPALLPIDIGDESAERHWLLVTREWAIHADGTRWSLDHLFLDDTGVPTLVECKLAFNPQARREVIGQALDYAAWFSVDCSEAIRRIFSTRCGAEGKDADAELIRAFGDTVEEFDPDRWWIRVDEQLARRRLRILIVGDTVSMEVRRVVEFLNKEMRNVEVLAVEYRLWESDGVKVLVPTVFGQDAETCRLKGRPEQSTEITFTEWLLTFRAKAGQAAADGMHALAEGWLANSGIPEPFLWCSPYRTTLHLKSGPHWYPGLYVTATRVVVPCRWLRSSRGVDEPFVRMHLAAIAEAVGEAVDLDNLGGFPSVSLGSLENPARLEALECAMGQFAFNVRALWKSLA